jgi:hypothetical protein
MFIVLRELAQVFQAKLPLRRGRRARGVRLRERTRAVIEVFIAR